MNKTKSNKKDSCKVNHPNNKFNKIKKELKYIKKSEYLKKFPRPNNQIIKSTIKTIFWMKLNLERLKLAILKSQISKKRVIGMIT